ncbi:outer membrane beta-barrel protein [Cytophaga aurantiaca]|uniref:outer membrane beta-barrel protein n=1 Tax=Cytophaga aurantiaca TaxID=29530 RepID=UPI0003646DAD|nr:outer membrane beta-barrel protein [Cytophaga aurantiaca]
MKQILLLLVVFAVISNANAQKIFTFGPMVGYTTSTLDNSTFTNNSAGSGYALGGFLRFDIKKWYLQPNVYYLSSSSSFDHNQSTTDAHLKSVNADLLLGYRIFKFTDLTYIRVFAGPSYSNINSLKYKNGDPTLNPNYSSDNVLLNVGAGIDVWKFTFDLKYQRGLTDIDNTSNSMHTNAFLITAGFKIL